MMRVAHRGLAGLYPENTMIAFEKCLEYNPEAIEMDVQMTKDGELIVFHDEEVSRCTGAKGWVKDMTLAELRELDPSNGFDIHDQKLSRICFVPKRGQALQLKKVKALPDGVGLIILWVAV